MITMYKLHNIELSLPDIEVARILAFAPFKPILAGARVVVNIWGICARTCAVVPARVRRTRFPGPKCV